MKLKESATLAINLKAIKLRKEGKNVYHWGFGQSPFPVPTAIQEELKNRTAHTETRWLLRSNQIAPVPSCL